MEIPVGKRRLVIRLARPEHSGPPPVGQAGTGETKGSDRRDLVRKHSKKMASGLAVLAVGLLVGSLAYGVRAGLPSVALDWLFGLQLIRAALAFAIVAGLVLLIVRGWGGLWPERFLTTGYEYPAEQDVEGGIARAITLASVLRHEIDPSRASEVGE
jgi:hypothetical protein